MKFQRWSLVCQIFIRMRTTAIGWNNLHILSSMKKILWPIISFFYPSAFRNELVWTCNGLVFKSDHQIEDITNKCSKRWFIFWFYFYNYIELKLKKCTAVYVPARKIIIIFLISLLCFPFLSFLSCILLMTHVNLSWALVWLSYL